MAYIATADITDVLAKQFTSDFSTYHTLVDAQMVDIAEQLGVASDEIETDDNGYIDSWYIRQYLVCWFCMRIFLDKMGINNVDFAETEKYRVKYEYYKGEVEKREQKITYEMVTGDVEEAGDRASNVTTGFIYRT